MYYMEDVKKWKSQTGLFFGQLPHETLTNVEMLKYLIRLPEDSEVSLSSYASHYKSPKAYVPRVYYNRPVPIKHVATIDLRIRNLYEEKVASEYTDKICSDADFALEHFLEKSRENK
ncbi:hypothetical protein HHI36_017515 [Cryptolaemus montrouzieri]|uniref:Uncharacterized protein n=1 Tax=Cryptolaemus montrouzieri TaxID=559131 RepID=A0ABD2NNH3_9CUCU